MIGTFGALFAHAAAGHQPTTRPDRRRARRRASLVVPAPSRWPSSGGAAVILERVAYRPLRKRGRAPPGRADLRHRRRRCSCRSCSRCRSSTRPSGRVPRVVVHKRRAVHVLRRRHPQRPGARDRRRRIVMMVALDQFVSRTRLGRGIRATAQDPETAQLMGVNIDRVVMLTFLLGGIMAGARRPALRRLLRAHRRSTSASSSASRRSPPPCSAASATSAARCSAACARPHRELRRRPSSAPSGRTSIAFVVLVLVLMFRPTGLLGEQLGRARA